MRSSFGKLNVESLESRDNPSGLSEFWDGVTYYGRAALEGLGEGLTNIATGAYDAVVELGRTGRDLVTIYSDWDNVDPSRLESKLFQGAAQTAGNPQAAAAFDNHLVFGIVTLGVGPLAESGYNAVITGDSTQFSQQAGGFGVMVLVAYAGVKGLNALPPVPLRIPLPKPSLVLQTVDGVLVTVPGGVAWAEVGVISFAIPTEVATWVALTGNVMAMTVTNPGGSGDVNPADFVGAQATTPPHLPAGTYCALVVDGKVYVARMHIICWELAGKQGNIQFYGSAQIDAAGTVVRLFK